MVIASRFMPSGRSEDDDRFLFGDGRITDTINGYRAITHSAWSIGPVVELSAC